MRPLNGRELAEWLCEYAGAMACLAAEADALGCAELTPMSAVDHIIPVTGRDDMLFFDPIDHQSLCDACHARKTRSESSQPADIPHMR
jgi:hypothetical protein